MKLFLSLRGIQLRYKMECSKWQRKLIMLYWEIWAHICTVRMGFAEAWVQRVMKFITSVSNKIHINNSLSREILCTRGLRQGDPVAPYLFILLTEWLYSQLCKLSENRRLGVKYVAELRKLLICFFLMIALFSLSLKKLLLKNWEISFLFVRLFLDKRSTETKMIGLALLLRIFFR